MFLIYKFVILFGDLFFIFRNIIYVLIDLLVFLFRILYLLGRFI